MVNGPGFDQHQFLARCGADSRFERRETGFFKRQQAHTNFLGQPAARGDLGL